MSNHKLTTAELAARLNTLQRALEDAATAREMLAEAESKVKRVRAELGSDYKLIRELFAPIQRLSPSGRRQRAPYTKVSRVIWMEPTLKVLRDARIAIPVVKVAELLRGTPGETRVSILTSRLYRLAKEGLCIRIEPENGDRMGVKYQTKPLTSGSTKPDPLIHRYGKGGEKADYDHRAPAYAAARS